MAICSSTRAAGICTAEHRSCLRLLHQHQAATPPTPITVPPFLGPPHPAAAGTGARDSSRGSGEKPLSFSAMSRLIFPDQPSKSQPFN